MKFQVDKISVRGPKVDGGYSVTMELGEYEQAKVAQLMAMPNDEIKTVEVTNE